MVGLVDSIIDREVENKGLDFIDTESHVPGPKEHQRGPS